MEGVSSLECALALLSHGMFPLIRTVLNGDYDRGYYKSPIQDCYISIRDSTAKNPANVLLEVWDFGLNGLTSLGARRYTAIENPKSQQL